MTLGKYKSWLAACSACLGLGVFPTDAAACGGEWYPELFVDPRIRGVDRAEASLASGNLVAAAASVIRMMPHIRALKSKPGSLVARGERILALALTRSGGSLDLSKEVPREISSGWQGTAPSKRTANLEWSAQVLERQSASKPDDVALKTDVAEVLSHLSERREDARHILEELAKRDLIASPQGYAALASVRRQLGDADGQRVALQRCEAMAKSADACTIRS